MNSSSPPVGQVIDGWQIIGRIGGTRSWNVKCVNCGHVRSASGVVVGKALTGIATMNACFECAPAYVMGEGPKWNGWNLIAEPDELLDRETLLAGDETDPYPGDRCAPDDSHPCCGAAENDAPVSKVSTVIEPACPCLALVADMLRAALHVIETARA